MLRLLGFLIKIGILVGCAIWLAARPGTVNIDWMDYDITIHLGFFLLILFVAIILSVALARLALYFKYLPARYREKKAYADAEKGLKALTLSLSAATAGNTGYVKYQAQQAEKLLPGDGQPLPVLLQAHALRHEGHHEQAETLLQGLLKDKEGSLLAARALISNAVDNNDHQLALSYGREALKTYKGRDEIWLVKTLYELEAQSQNWDAALSLLKKLDKKEALDPGKVKSDRAAIYTAQAWASENYQDHLIYAEQVKFYKQALKADPGFTPAAVGLAKLYGDHGKTANAYRIVEKAWGQAPHPELAELWMNFQKLQRKKPTSVNWAFRLTKTNPDHIDSYILRTRAALADGQWEEARAALQSAEEISPQRRVYRLWARLDTQTQSPSYGNVRIDEVADARPDPVWMCQVTGKVYAKWQPVAEPPGGFNTIAWIAPTSGMMLPLEGHNNLRESGDFGLITSAS